MTHPVHHAQSSARHYKGKWEDYIEVHHWLDATKEHFADFRHRALRHHAQGIFEAERLFGRALVNSEGRVVPVRYLGEMHVLEDCRTVPSLADWAAEMRPPEWWRGEMDARAQARASADEFGGRPDDHLWLHEWLDAHRSALPACWGFLRHHAEGVAEACAARPGYPLSGRGEADTRKVAEAHVRRACDGELPTACAWLRRFRMRLWMAKPSPTRLDRNGRPKVGNLTRPAVDP